MNVTEIMGILLQLLQFRDVWYTGRRSKKHIKISSLPYKNVLRSFKNSENHLLKKQSVPKR